MDLDKVQNKDAFSRNTEIRLGISNTRYSNTSHASSTTEAKATSQDFRAPDAQCQTLYNNQVDAEHRKQLHHLGPKCVIWDLLHLDHPAPT